MAKNWVIWDGDCGFCAWSIDRLMAMDKQNRLTPVTAERCPSPPMTPELAARSQTGVILVTEDGTTAHGADAVLGAMRLTSRGRWAAVLLYPPFIWLARPVYALIAKNRGRISARFFGGKPCGIAHRGPLPDKDSPKI